MGGDFNLYFDTFLDADGGNPKLKINSLSRLISMMEENELSDIFRIRYPDSRQFTWRCKNPLKQRRLYYLLTSDSLQHEVETIDKYYTFSPIRSFCFKDEALFITRKETRPVTLEV